MADQAAAAAAAGYTVPPDHDQGGRILRTVWVLISLSTVVVAARIYTKARKTHRLYWDDYLIFLALLFGFVHAALVSKAVSTGMGRHMMYLTPDQREDTFRIGALTLVWAFLSPMTGRIGFCVTLLFLTGTDPGVKRWPIWVVIFLQLAVNISTIIVFYTQCGGNVDIMWRIASTGNAALYLEKCENYHVQTDYGYFQGSFNTLTDAFLTALPAILIEHTRLSVRAKLGLSLLLCLSVLAMIASIVKTYYAKALSEQLDYTWDLCSYVIWLSVELNVVIIVASVPLLRPMFERDRRRTGSAQLQKWDTSTTLSSIFSKKRARTNLSRVDSEENIIEPQGNQYPMERMGIQVTHEVTVTYQPSDQAYVHAALVGLVQGEIANPRLART
ncbi:hypothetical protein LTR36_006416 [Oleoguttula mirabilis]|uniref:Rhodopsin domain-containing protein n=1 Tax=Oleoguttula mirabilis TaxID=1507867 RepID=A0AAV9JVT4_9PEZI|nr:hypothetical protein LTR36_006416 [Oleoguttula mirabilis]